MATVDVCEYDYGSFLFAEIKQRLCGFQHRRRGDSLGGGLRRGYTLSVIL